MRVSFIIIHKVGSSLLAFEVTFTYIFRIVIWYTKDLCIVILLKSLVVVTITIIKYSSSMLQACEGINSMATHCAIRKSSWVIKYIIKVPRDIIPDTPRSKAFNSILCVLFFKYWKVFCEKNRKDALYKQWKFTS